MFPFATRYPVSGENLSSRLQKPLEAPYAMAPYTGRGDLVQGAHQRLSKLLLSDLLGTTLRSILGRLMTFEKTSRSIKCP